MAALSSVILRGVAGSRPAAASVSVGTLYFSTDTLVTERSNGSTWDSYSSTGAGSGTVTNSGTLTSGQLIQGNGGVQVTVNATTATVTKLTAGVPSAASAGTDYVAPGGALGTPSSGTLSSCTGLPVSTGISGLGTGVATALAVNVGTAGAPIVNGGALGTPSSGTLTNCTGLPTTGLGAGAMVQVVKVETGAVSTGSTVLPVDDTIPQIGEGNEVMTLAVTPKSATNLLKIDVVCVVGNSNGSRFEAAALFQDSTLNALAAVSEYQGAAGALNILTFTHYLTAGTTSATTFRVRAGADSTGTMTFNGIGGTRQFGGVMASSITITEIAV